MRQALELERIEILNVEPDMELSFWQAVRKVNSSVIACLWVRACARIPAHICAYLAGFGAEHG